MSILNLIGIFIASWVLFIVIDKATSKIKEVAGRIIFATLFAIGMVLIFV